jgi:hypothetical protein
MKKILMLLVVLVAFGIVKADTTTVVTKNKAMRIDTVKAALEPPEWQYSPSDTTFIDKQSKLKVVVLWTNSNGAIKVVDTTYLWKPTENTLGTYRYQPVISVRFKN